MVDGGDAAFGLYGLDGPTRRTDHRTGDTGGDLFTDDSLGSNLGESRRRAEQLKPSWRRIRDAGCRYDVGALDTRKMTSRERRCLLPEVTPTFGCGYSDKRAPVFSQPGLSSGLPNNRLTPLFA